MTRVKFSASETKARTKRYAFVTKEVLEWLSQYRRDLPRPSEWVFVGEKGGHLGSGTARTRIKRLFKLCGMKDTDDEKFSTHSFRTFCDSQMSKAGLDRKYIAAIIGHKSKLAAESHYLDWDEIGQRWAENVEPKMTWLTEKVEVVKEVVDIEARRVLAGLVKLLGEAETYDDVPDLSGLIQAGEKALEDKTRQNGQPNASSKKINVA